MALETSFNLSQTTLELIAPWNGLQVCNRTQECWESAEGTVVGNAFCVYIDEVRDSVCSCQLYYMLGGVNCATPTAGTSFAFYTEVFVLICAAVALMYPSLVLLLAPCFSSLDKGSSLTVVSLGFLSTSFLFLRQIMAVLLLNGSSETVQSYITFGELLLSIGTGLWAVAIFFLGILWLDILVNSSGFTHSSVEARRARKLKNFLYFIATVEILMVFISIIMQKPSWLAIIAIFLWIGIIAVVNTIGRALVTQIRGVHSAVSAAENANLNRVAIESLADRMDSFISKITLACACQIIFSGIYVFTETSSVSSAFSFNKLEVITASANKAIAILVMYMVMSFGLFTCTSKLRTNRGQHHHFRKNSRVTPSSQATAFQNHHNDNVPKYSSPPNDARGNQKGYVSSVGFWF